MKTWVFAAALLVTTSQLLMHQARAAGAPIIGGSKLYISASGPTSADGYTYMSPNDLPTTVYFQWCLRPFYALVNIWLPLLACSGSWSTGDDRAERYHGWFCAATSGVIAVALLIDHLRLRAFSFKSTLETPRARCWRTMHHPAMPHC